jgi:hypothetical protein
MYRFHGQLKRNSQHALQSNDIIPISLQNRSWGHNVSKLVYNLLVSLPGMSLLVFSAKNSTATPILCEFIHVLNSFSSQKCTSSALHLLSLQKILNYFIIIKAHHLITRL